MSNLASDLMQFTGSETIYRHWSKRILYTEGCHYLAEKAGAHWLIDLIASHQPTVRNEHFQLWILRVDLETRTGVVTCQSDSNEPALVRQLLEFTDFPLEEIRLYVVGDPGEGVLMLTSEY